MNICCFTRYSWRQLNSNIVILQYLNYPPKVKENNVHEIFKKKMKEFSSIQLKVLEEFLSIYLFI